MQRIAIIDIGSNSARLVISHIYKNGAYNMVYNQKEALRLSQKVDRKNMLTEAAFTSTIETMKSFAYMCKIYRVDKTIAVATAAIRNAYNGADLVSRVMEETEIQLHIISGNTEAYISYLGVINTLDVRDGIIFDLGGGSTELILFQDRQIVESVSLPLGAVNTTGMFNTRNEMPPNVYSDLSFFITSVSVVLLRRIQQKLSAAHLAQQSRQSNIWLLLSNLFSYRQLPHTTRAVYLY